eukprot:gene5960-9959_t
MKEKDFILENPTKILYQAIPFEFRKEKEFVLKVLSLTEETGVFYIYLPLSMRLDSEICKTALKHANYPDLEFELSRSFFEFIPDELLKTEKIYKAILDSNLEVPLTYCPPNIQTKEIVLKVLHRYPKEYNWVNLKFRSDADVLLIGIGENAALFDKYATIHLKSDENFVKKAMSKNLLIYKDILIEMKERKQLIEFALQEPSNCSFIPPKYFIENPDIALDFFSKNEYYCQYLPTALQRNVKFLKKLPPINTWQYLPKLCFDTLLKNDEKFIIETIKDEPYTFKSCKKLHEYENVLNIAYSIDKSVICYLESIPKNKLIEYLDESPELIKHLSDSVKKKYDSDEDFKIYKIRGCPSEFSTIGPFLNDKATMQKYMKISGFCLCWAHRFQKDKETVLIALQSSQGEALEFADPSFKSDKDVMMIACELYGRNLSYASKEIQDDYDVVKVAVSNNGTAIKFASNRLKLDPTLSLIAIEQTRGAYRDLHPTMKTHIDIWLVYQKRYRLLQPTKQQKLQDIHFLFN